MYRVLAFDRPLIRLPEQMPNLDGGQMVEVTVGEHGLDRGIFHGDSPPDAALFSARSRAENSLGAIRAKVRGTSIYCSVDYISTSDIDYKQSRNYWSNRILWDAFHDLPLDRASDIRTRRKFLQSYDRLNRRFAKRAAIRIQHNSSDSAHIFWQDYQLLGAAKHFRQSYLGQSGRVSTSHFLHVPFPTVDSFLRLPEWLQRYVMEGLLGNNRIVFQAPRDVERFLHIAEECFGYERSGESTIRWDGRDVHLRASPFPLDVAWLQQAAHSRAAREFREYVRSTYREGKNNMLVGLVGRIDPIKNFPDAIRAIGEASARLEQRKNISVLACCQPARLEGPSGLVELAKFNQAVEELSNRWRGTPSTVEVLTSPNVYKAVGLYAECDILVVPSLRDGLNLVGAEGALLTERNGVSVLSEGIGLAQYMKSSEAILVSPNREGLSDGLAQALALSDAQRSAMSRSAKQRVLEMPWAQWLAAQEAV